MHDGVPSLWLTLSYRRFFSYTGLDVVTKVFDSCVCSHLHVLLSIRDHKRSDLFWGGEGGGPKEAPMRPCCCPILRSCFSGTSKYSISGISGKRRKRRGRLKANWVRIDGLFYLTVYPRTLSPVKQKMFVFVLPTIHCTHVRGKESECNPSLKLHSIDCFDA